MPVFHPCEVKPWQNVGREESLGQEGPPEKEMATYANVLAWGIPWTEKAGGLQSMGSQRVRHDCATKIFR